MQKNRNRSAQCSNCGSVPFERRPVIVLEGIILSEEQVIGFHCWLIDTSIEYFIKFDRRFPAELEDRLTDHSPYPPSSSDEDKSGESGL